MRLTAKRKRAFLEGIRRVINNETVSICPGLEAYCEILRLPWLAGQKTAGFCLYCKKLYQIPIHITEANRRPGFRGCPCGYHGKEKTIELSKQILKEHGV